MSPGLEAIAGSLASEQFNTRIVDECRERTNRVGAAAHAGDDDVRQTSFGGQQLCTRLIADDTLEITHKLRERVRTRGCSENVVRGLNVGHPVTERLVNCVLERRRTRGHSDDLSAEHLHARNIEGLTLGVLAPHVDRAVEAEERSGGRGGHAVLTRTGLRNNTRLTQFLGQQRLAKHVVDLVRTRVVEVLTLKKHAHAAKVRSEARRLRQQRRTSRVVQEKIAQPALERLIAPQALPRGLNLFEGTHERLGDEASAEITEVRSLSKVLGFHHCPS